MKNLDEFKSRKEWEEFIWMKFLEDIIKIKSVKRLKENLDIIISKKEKHFIIKRLLTIYFINTGKKYREIGNYLWISPSTISAIKKSAIRKINYQSRIKIDNLKNNKNNYKNKKLGSDRSFKKKFEEMADINWEMINSLGLWMDKNLPPISGRGRWKYLNNY